MMAQSGGESPANDVGTRPYSTSFCIGRIRQFTALQ
jgi:hypothetical protein